MSEKYHTEVQNLLVALNGEDRRAEAAELLRSLIEKIEMTPDERREKLIVSLYGDLAGILTLAIGSQNKKVSNGQNALILPSSTPSFGLELATQESSAPRPGSQSALL
jgi:hypothetical protein